MIFRRCLRNFPVLTELAPKRTSGSGKRICRSPRQVMVKWFFFDWINMDGYGAAIDKALQFSFDIHARPASSPLTVNNSAAIGTKKTFDNGFLRGIAIAFYCERLPVAGLWS